MEHQALPQEIIAYVLSKVSAVRSDAVKKARDDIEINFKRHAAMLQNYNPRHADFSAGQGDVPCVMLRCLRTMDTERLCGVSYPWLSDATVGKESIVKWEHLIGTHMPVLELDCDHFGLFEPAHVSGHLFLFQVFLCGNCVQS